MQPSSQSGAALSAGTADHPSDYPVTSPTAQSSANSPLEALLEARREARDLSIEPALGDPGSRRAMRLGLLAVFSLVVGLALWASVARLAETAVTRGELVTTGAVKVVQHLEGGMLAELLVAEGQLVEAGDVLVRLASAGAHAELDRLRVRRLALAIRRERLAASVEWRLPDFAQYDSKWRLPKWQEAGRAIVAPKANGGAEAGAALYRELTAAIARREGRRGGRVSAPASPGDVDVDRLIDGQLEIQRAQLESVASERLILSQQIQQRNSRMTSVQRETRSINTRLGLLVKEVKMREALLKRSAEPKITLLSARGQLQQTRSELARAEGTMATTEAEIRELESKLDEVDVRWRASLLEELGTVDSELAETREQLVTLRDRVTRLEVTAPVRGIVQALPVKNIGAVFPPGGIVAELVPAGEALVAETRVLTTDIGFVSAGQEARVKVDTFNYSRFGALTGEIESVSATTLLDESGNPYYKARIRLDGDSLQKGDRTFELLPGMTVQADIGTGEKTLLEYLLKPVYTNLDQAFRER